MSKSDVEESMSDASDSEPTKIVVEEREKRTTRLPAKHKDYVSSTSKVELLQKVSLSCIIYSILYEPCKALE